MDLITIDRLLKFGIFNIPVYQRGYSWTNTQISEFLEDIEESQNIKSHYTGTITLLKSGEEMLGFAPYQIFDVIDGQQRLITIHLLLSCFYFRIRELKQDDINIISYYSFNGIPLIRLNSNDQNFYTTLINERDVSRLRAVIPNNKTQKNLLFAKEKFAKYLSNKSLAKLRKLYSQLLTKFNVNVFEVDSEDEVGLIFETMNDRGLPLSDIDKVKNYLIYICHRFNDNNLARDINRRFGSIFKELIKVEFYNNVLKTENIFLKNAYIVFTGDTKELQDIHKKVKNELITKYANDGQRTLFTNTERGINQKRNQIKNFVSFLTKSAKEYAKIFNCDFGNDNVNELLFRLKQLGYLDNFIPILLAVSSKNYPITHLEKILEIIEVYAVRIFCIENKKSNLGINSIYEIAYKIYSNETNFTQVKKDIKLLIKKHSNGNSLKSSIIKESAYDKKSTSIIKYFLYEYEKFLTQNENTLFIWPSITEFFTDFEKVYTIEHIAPQNKMPGDEKIKNIHYFGNLVLSKQNRQLENKSFTQKKEIYRDSDLLSERKLCLIEKWNDREINNRSKELASFALNRWKI
jgi:uncharacterized protein with ParB-like and HNH nuclease domain